MLPIANDRGLQLCFEWIKEECLFRFEEVHYGWRYGLYLDCVVLGFVNVSWWELFNILIDGHDVI